MCIVPLLGMKAEELRDCFPKSAVNHTCHRCLIVILVALSSGLKLILNFHGLSECVQSLKRLPELQFWLFEHGFLYFCVFKALFLQRAVFRNAYH